MVVAPTELRQALAGLGGGDFSEYAMHDASEALLHLYNLLHAALAGAGALTGDACAGGAFPGLCDGSVPSPSAPVSYVLEWGRERSTGK